MDAVDFINTKTRMCYSFPDCKGCPLKEDSRCRKIEYNPEEAVDIVETWAKENPIITNGDKFKEVFGIYINLVKSDWWAKEYKKPENAKDSY